MPVAALWRLAQYPSALPGMYFRTCRTHLVKSPGVPHRIFAAPSPVSQYLFNRAASPSPGVLSTIVCSSLVVPAQGTPHEKSPICRITWISHESDRRQIEVLVYGFGPKLCLQSMSNPHLGMSRGPKLGATKQRFLYSHNLTTGTLPTTLGNRGFSLFSLPPGPHLVDFWSERRPRSHNLDQVRTPQIQVMRQVMRRKKPLRTSI